MDKDYQYINALKIEERLEAFTAANLAVSDDPILIEEKWLNVNSLAGKDLFDKKLELMGITTEQFAFLIKDFSEYEMSLLYDYLKESIWFKTYQDIMIKYKETYNNEKAVNDQLILPFIKYIKNKLYSIYLNNIQLSNNALEHLCQGIASQLSKLTLKCVIIEMEDYKKKHILKGNDGNSRYLDFLDNNFKTPCQLEIFYRKYPVLARLLTQKMLDLLSGIEKMLTNIDENYLKIDSICNLKSEYITEILCSQGDTHKRGKSVAKITLDNGKIFVYKPRNSYIEKAFYEFSDYINKHSNLKELYINNSYYDNDFTVESYIEHNFCNTVKDVEEFYYRFGEMTALVGLLLGTDFHSENIIALNKYPVIVDFETLFSQPIFSYDEEREYTLINNKKEIFNLSATALLPVSAFTNNLDKKGIDVSGLAGGDPVTLPKKILMIKDLYTDTMHYEYTFINKKRDNNKPVLEGEIHEFHLYKDKIYIGFSDMLEYFMHNKIVLSEVIKNLFKNIEVRQVLKATAVYSELLSYMDHPNYLKDMLYMERLLDNNYAYPYRNKKIVVNEIKDMSFIEIPIFYTNTSQKYLMTSTGEIFCAYYRQSALERVLNSINCISHEIAEYEKIKFKILLGDYFELTTKRLIGYSDSLAQVKVKEYHKEDILRVCLSMGHEIVSSACFSESKKNISWHYINTLQNYPSITYMNNSFYNGRTGISMYLNYLNNLIPDKEISSFNDQLLNTIDFSNEDIDNSVYNGQASALYLKIKTNNFKDGDYIKLKDLLTKLHAIPDSEVYDWLGGVSGYIKLFIEIYKSGMEQDTARSLMDRYTSHLVRIINENESRMGVDIGFGHGEIGIIYALLISQSVLDKNFKNEINLLLERVEIKLKAFNMEDLSSRNSWCHGFGGLGIGSLACKSYLDDSRLDYFINYSFNMIKEADPVNMCLCHGLGGDIDFLISMTECYPDNTYTTEVLTRKISKIVTFYNTYGYALLNELPEFKDYGLYTGLSGVGMALLRSINTGLIPSVLI